MSDSATDRYFDEHTPQWSVGRYRHALEWLRAQPVAPDHHLVDIGCGNGNVLAAIRAQTAVPHLTGLDASAAYLDQVRQRLDCPTIHASILDDDALAPHTAAFDTALLGDVLHHLVGPTRRASRRLARHALLNGLRLLKPGGHLLILEPIFTPGWLAPLAFYTKTAVTHLHPQRLDLGRRWANIGAPVVLFFSVAELEALLATLPHARLLALTLDHRRRLAPAIHHHRLTAVLQHRP